MLIKIWNYDPYKKESMFLFNTDCTQQFVEDNYYLIAETDEDREDWFKNLSVNGQLYDVHCVTSYKDTNRQVKNVFVTPYWIKSLKEIKENPIIENLNNAICPVCGYVDRDCWENRCPDEHYYCPQCKSNLLLEHRFEFGYTEYDNFMYQRTTFKKLHRPKKIKVLKEEK